MCGCSWLGPILWSQVPGGWTRFVVVILVSWYPKDGGRRRASCGLVGSHSESDGIHRYVNTYILVIQLSYTYAYEGETIIFLRIDGSPLLLLLLHTIPNLVVVVEDNAPSSLWLVGGGMGGMGMFVGVSSHSKSSSTNPWRDAGKFVGRRRRR